MLIRKKKQDLYLLTGNMPSKLKNTRRKKKKKKKRIGTLTEEDKTRFLLTASMQVVKKRKKKNLTNRKRQTRDSSIKHASYNNDNIIDKTALIE